MQLLVQLVRWPCFERQRAGGATAASAAGLEYHANISREAAKRHKSGTDAGVPCVEGPGCTGLKNGVAQHAHSNPQFLGKCVECYKHMLGAARSKGRK